MSSLEQKIDVDYYKILGVAKNATIPQICAKYHEIALANHPALQHSNPNAAYQRFAQAAEAFDVLYDRIFKLMKPKRRVSTTSTDSKS